LQFLIGAEAGIGFALLHQLVNILPVKLLALRLPVWSMLPSNVRTCTNPLCTSSVGSSKNTGALFSGKEP
jgi:hypothetical protein